MNDSTLYRRFWRWHFYAGLFVIPFVLVLSLSGSIFLFKPQVDRWEERAFQHLPAGATTPGQQLQAALAAYPGARFHSYRLPPRPDEAALVHLALAQSGAMRDVFVSPQGVVLGSFDPDSRIIAVVRRIHGQLLLGPRGSWLVELAASWAIVMIITGLYLWWPRGRGAAGVIWPRRRSLLRDLHAVTGFWVAGFALVLLISGLPWADVWGSAFTAVRTEMGWVKGQPPWTVGGRVASAADQHAGHDHDAMHAEPGHAHVNPDVVTQLDQLAIKATREQLAFPAWVVAPDHAPAAADVWTVKSSSQSRPLQVTITYADNGDELSREGFSDAHPIDRVVGYGISWHEGQLFGVVNQIIGVVTALALTVMTVTGFMMWRRRRPAGQLGAPALPQLRRKSTPVVIVTVLLACVLPMLAISLLLLWLIDMLVPRVSPAAAAWLGIVRRSTER